MKKESELIVTLNIEQLKRLISESVEDTVTEVVKPPPPFKTFPIKDAAEILGVYPQTLRNYADNKIIDSYRVGNRYYFTLDAIKRFIDNGGSTVSTQQAQRRKHSKAGSKGNLK